MLSLVVLVYGRWRMFADRRRSHVGPNSWKFDAEIMKRDRRICIHLDDPDCVADVQENEIRVKTVVKIQNERFS